MKEIFEKIDRHLYRRQYQSAAGEWKTIYYARFVDWQGKRRTFPLGSEIKPARDGLALYEARNVKKENFDADKVKGITLNEWLKRYLDLVKATASYETKTAQCLHLKRLLGHLPLTEINRVKIMEYKNRRLSEAIIRYDEAVDGTRIKGATVNREVSCLVTALNLAADQGLCGGAPKIKKERETPRDRILTETEYKAIVDAAPRWLQRIVIAANETAIDQGGLLKLTWECVQSDLIVVRGGRAKTGARQAVGVSPALKYVLDELRAEFRRVSNTDRRVFTKGGKPIPKGTLRHGFDKAVDDAKVEDFQFRDFRHCARTRWAAAGLPFEIGELGIGHKLRGMAGRYINLSDDQIREAFRQMFEKMATTWQQEKSGTAE
jgi:integrase